MLVLRSLLFNIAFYANLIARLVLYLPLLALPRPWLMAAVRDWARSSLWLLRVIAGTKAEFRGLDLMPAGGCIIASKHQSLWETFALLTIAKDPVFVLKRELSWLPFFGWYALKARMIPVDRGKGAPALAAMAKRVGEEIAKGRQIIIFPEGTRRPPGAKPAYKYGVVHLYNTLDVPCLPVALNSGLYWPRRQFIKRPGTIIVQCLPPIPPGLSRLAFRDRVAAEIEEASNRLIAEARQTGGTPAPAHAGVA
ncbi:1-acyl-sn-glycerol-3-phosphate acyltransferase [Chelatococcus asaccharovorans]|uniref:1-acyl-sn-glycerol-3-phosphate acyltransferase n=2 Tax=Chelatococcus asaccharovorans TaxID=28210 RepID=A0A2V3UAE1_9HYPH|nr:lysophospholipid acyltransferase family protein [Chelatococcus asaccharovorans]MBS7705363.1 1-acyl-sn-glycerol-3-phosphate acyltransferase [Chelatococcus asaccharovorans]PXW60234.1 1-acyl-sn-glycerol-3-phosphate acyltransferase [Chelatococcus asaccharovorans]CAH1655055.1 1-acyl-sn-glycerol-3-phosphate acyltransferase [Chelatococcus asaccharovorans]CAH1685549.1 1-acyl-sn-glycerol-3-phosphate acyltransferase [Chelatococcus asaccharovorans]